MAINAFLRLIGGPDPDQKLDTIVMQFAVLAGGCAKHFMETKAGDLRAVLEFEHEGDRLKREARVHLDGNYIFARYRGEPARRLFKQLDDIVGDMKRAAEFVEIWRPILGEIPKEADRFFLIIREMANILSRLTVGIGTGKSDPRAHQALMAELDGKESEADALRIEAERRLVEESVEASLKERDRRDAAIRLLDLLEEVVDSINHAGDTLEVITGRS